MNTLEAKLLNNYQKHFPLHSLPFSELACSLDTTSEQIIRVLSSLKARGYISRIGAVFRPNSVGVSTLAALAVPQSALERTARMISDYENVNHNYERDHYYNLWFVVTAEDSFHLDSVLQSIEKNSGLPLLVLPLVRDYHIDLGFSMDLCGTSPMTEKAMELETAVPVNGEDEQQAINDKLIAAVQEGLPIIERPYQSIAQRIGSTEESVISGLMSMIRSEVIRRFGVVVRHRKLGYRANAMVVWDVPRDRVDDVGRRLGSHPAVTLSYQRPRRLPEWPYNLFTMLHGRDQKEVMVAVTNIVREMRLGDISKDILFSVRCFKQRGACYRRVS